MKFNVKKVLNGICQCTNCAITSEASGIGAGRGWPYFALMRYAYGEE